LISGLVYTTRKMDGLNINFFLSRSNVDLAYEFQLQFLEKKIANNPGPFHGISIFFVAVPHRF
jgi:hypothetical protein